MPSGTLSSDFDSVVFEGLILTTNGDAVKSAQIKINSTNINVSQGTDPMISFLNVNSLMFKVTFIRTSSTSLRVESVFTQVADAGVFNYSISELIYTTGYDYSTHAYRNGQVVTVLDMDSNSFDIDLDLLTLNSSQPLKLVNCKLLKLKKV